MSVTSVNVISVGGVSARRANMAMFTINFIIMPK